MGKTVAAKIGTEQNMRTIFVNAPADAMQAIDPSNLAPETTLSGDFDYIHFFTKSRREFQQKFPTLKSHLKQRGMLWVSWPKSGQKNTDLSMKSVIKLGYDHGLVESKCISINTVWSALKFTHPKKGKIYNNSYGELRRR